MRQAFSKLRALRWIILALALIATTYQFGFSEGWHFFLKILAFIFVISVIVFVHEFGHYIIAKWAGVKIDVFSLGFGRELTGWTDRSGTRWRVSALPLGGYVKMFGDASEASTPLESLAQMSDADKSKTFYHKSLPKKAAIVAAGPVFNFILTIFILTAFIIKVGLPSLDPIVGNVQKDTPAAEAGLQPGDRILSINGQKVRVFFDISRIIATNLGTPVELKLLRGSEVKEITLTPKQAVDKDSLNSAKRPIIGIMSKEITYKDVGLPRAVWEATRETYYTCATTLKAIGQMIVGDRDVKDNLSGPIGIVKISGQAADRGIGTVFLLMANLSANLGLFNLFPVPLLDGGHLLYYGIEAVQRRPLTRRVQEMGFRIGLAMIVMLMAFATFNDIHKWLLTLVAKG